MHLGALDIRYGTGRNTSHASFASQNPQTTISKGDKNQSTKHIKFLTCYNLVSVNNNLSLSRFVLVPPLPKRSFQIILNFLNLTLENNFCINICIGNYCVPVLHFFMYSGWDFKVWYPRMDFKTNFVPLSRLCRVLMRPMRRMKKI